MPQRVVPVSAFLGRHMYACITSIAQYTLGEADCIGGTVRGEGSEAALVVFAAELQVVIKFETERPRIFVVADHSGSEVSHVGKGPL